MRLTPLDIRKQDFKRTFRGFEPEEVEAFLQMLSNQWQEILDEERKLQDKIRELEGKLKHYITVEEALQQALKTTRDSAKQTLENAKEKAALIIEEAENRAVEIKRHAEEERHQLKRDTAKVSGRRNEIVARLRAFLMSEMELLARYEGDDPVGFIRLMPADERRLSAADVEEVVAEEGTPGADPQQARPPRQEASSPTPEPGGGADPLSMPPLGEDAGAGPEASEEAPAPEDEEAAESLLSAAAAFLDHTAGPDESEAVEEPEAVAEPEPVEEPEAVVEPALVEEPEADEEPEAEEEPEAVAEAPEVEPEAMEMEEEEEDEVFGAPISLDEAASMAAMTVMDHEGGVLEDDDLEEEDDLAIPEIDITLPESATAVIEDQNGKGTPKKTDLGGIFADDAASGGQESDKVGKRKDAPAKAKSGEGSPVKKTPVTESSSSKPGWVLHSLLSPSGDDEATEQKDGGVTASADELAEIRRILDDLD